MVVLDFCVASVSDILFELGLFESGRQWGVSRSAAMNEFKTILNN